MAQFQCKQCLTVTELPDGSDPHAHTWCNCCTQTGDTGEIHHHGENSMLAADCEAANHPGQPCWHPPAQPVRPDGCTVCRPVIHMAKLSGPLDPAGPVPAGVYTLAELARMGIAVAGLGD